MKFKHTAFLAVLLLAHSSNVRAFQILKCNGNPVRWPSAFGTVQNLCSIPVGSGQSGAYVNAIDQWRAIRGMNDMVFHSGVWPADHCTVDLDDDWNDVALLVKGNHIIYSINGQLMTDLTDDSPKALKEGVLAFQVHAGFTMEIQFKDIKLKPAAGAKADAGEKEAASKE